MHRYRFHRLRTWENLPEAHVAVHVVGKMADAIEVEVFPTALPVLVVQVRAVVAVLMIVLLGVRIIGKADPDLEEKTLENGAIMDAIACLSLSL